MLSYYILDIHGLLLIGSWAPKMSLILKVKGINAVENLL